MGKVAIMTACHIKRTLRNSLQQMIFQNYDLQCTMFESGLSNVSYRVSWLRLTYIKNISAGLDAFKCGKFSFNL